MDAEEYDVNEEDVETGEEDEGFMGEIVVSLDDIVKEKQYYRIVTTHRGEMRGSALRRFSQFRSLKTRLSILKSIKADFPSRFTGLANSRDVTKKRCTALNVWMREAAHRSYQRGTSRDKHLIKRFLALSEQVEYQYDDDDQFFSGFNDDDSDEDGLSVASSSATLTHKRTPTPQKKKEKSPSITRPPPVMPEIQDTKRLEAALGRAAELDSELAAFEKKASAREAEADSKVASLTAVLAQLIAERDTLSHENTELETANQQLQNEYTETQNKLEEQHNATALIQKELDSLRDDTDLRRNKQTVASLRGQVSSLEAEVATLRSFAERNTLEANVRESNLIQKIAQVTADRDRLQAEQQQNSFAAFRSRSFTYSEASGPGDRTANNSSFTTIASTKQREQSASSRAIRGIFSSCCLQDADTSSRRQHSLRPPVPIVPPAPPAVSSSSVSSAS